MNDPRVGKHAETLGSHGFNVTVICPMSHGKASHEFARYYEVIRVGGGISASLRESANKPRASSANGHPKTPQQGKSYSLKRVVTLTSSFFLTQLLLLDAAKKQRAQIYCANDIDTLLAANLAAGVGGIVVYDSHELWTDMMLAPEYLKAIVRRMEKVLIKRPMLVMTVNEFIANELASRYSLTRAPQVVHNYPKVSLRGGRVRHRSRLRVALYQGMFSPDRGLENLIKASDYFLPDVGLVLRGYGVIERELKSMGASRKNVRFANPVKMNELVSAAAQADIGIVPTLPTNLNNYLRSPNNLFEYVQAGLPIVACDIPFLRKVILENDIGILFDYRDPQSLANAVNRATRSNVLKRQRVNVASVAKRFTWSVESEKLLKLYEDLLPCKSS